MTTFSTVCVAVTHVPETWGRISNANLFKQIFNIKLIKLFILVIQKDININMVVPFMGTANHQIVVTILEQDKRIFNLCKNEISSIQ